MTMPDDDFDPFNAPPDPEREQEILIRSLQMAQSFVLIFAVTNSATERNRRMEAVSAALPDKRIQYVPVTTETRNLIHYLREFLETPRPDAVFVYGLENWISGAVNPRSIPFLLNLNVARDSYPLVLPKPMVLWVPQYVLNAIADAAPDFFSVRSGVYSFPISSQEREEMAEHLTQLGLSESMGASLPERTSLLQSLEGLLAEYKSLPEENRNPVSEIHLMERIGLQLEAEGRDEEAGPLFEEALKKSKEVFNYPSNDIGAALNNLANHYNKQGDYKKSEMLYNESLEICRKVLPYPHKDMAAVLTNLASLYTKLQRYPEAEDFFQEALSICRQVLKYPHNEIATVLRNLAILYRVQGRYNDAEKLLTEAVDICRSTLPYPHFETAVSINNLALIYRLQGRYAEALNLFDESLSMLRASLDSNHPYIKTTNNNINDLIQKMFYKIPM